MLDRILPSFLKKRFKSGANSQLPFDFEPAAQDIIKKVAPYTMTSPERIYALYKAIEYISSFGIDGSIVECGVWKGGSAMASALSLKQFNDESRSIYLYDTFQGMTEPTAQDVDSYSHQPALTLWRDQQRQDLNEWCYASVEEVKSNLKKTNYPEENLIYVKGSVLETIPALVPTKIALLRLDTDWYDSTYHELQHLFPRLVKHGVLIIDDYGHWKGCRKATEQYLQEYNVKIYLSRIDYTARLGIKLSDSSPI